jgi:hypothetical protein
MTILVAIIAFFPIGLALGYEWAQYIHENKILKKRI